MPEKIGNYYLFQLCAGLSPVDTVNYSEFVAPLGDGFYEQSLFGSNTGTKAWNFNFPTLGNSTNQTIVFRGTTYTSPQQYVRDLSAWQKVTGEPFVVADPNYGQYYLARFNESARSMEKKMSGLYASQIQLVQVRVPGVTVFDPSKLNLWGWFTDAANNFTNSGWTDALYGKILEPNMMVPDDLTVTPDAQNGLPVLTFNETTGGNYLMFDEALTFKQFFLVMRINEEEFSNFAGVLAPADIGMSAILIGHDGETKFFNLGLSGSQKYAYEKNSIEYAESNQQAPMDEFALVYLRGENGFPVDILQIGKDRNYTDRYARMDIGEFIPTTVDLGFEKTLELIEHLMVKWDLH